MPAYNETDRIGSTLGAVQDYLGRQDYDWELIVSDDGSTDETPVTARAAFRGPHCRVIGDGVNRGKGAAVRRGMLDACGRVRLFTDADNSTPIEELDNLLEAMRESRAAVVIGSRAAAGARLEVRQPLYRELMGRTFNLVVRALAVPGIADTQCGFKLFTAPAAEYLFGRQRLDGFSFDVEVLMRARERGMRVVETPVRWIDNPASRVSPGRDSLRMLRDIVRLRLDRSLRAPGGRRLRDQ